MPEPSSRELNDKIAEIREWLVRIDTKMDYMSEVKRVADEADEKADKALVIANENRDAIRDMKSNTKWLWGVFIALAGVLTPVVIAVFQ